MRTIGGGCGAMFKSSHPFKKEKYLIKISPIFEDVAGNRIGETLDHSVNEKPDSLSGRVIMVVVH
jgi:hypothetical protein